MRASTTDTLKGSGHELKGALKQKAAQVTGNRKLEAEGKAEKITGTIQKKIGQVKRFLGK